MARGKTQIKKIENLTSRQVTYSKRRSGLFKKAHELTVLCDAKISIIMFSGTNRLHEYISPSIGTKQFFDLYQRTLGIDLWSTHNERMQEHLNKLREVNRRLRQEIGQRIGKSLDEMNLKELNILHEDIESSLKVIHEVKTLLRRQVDNQRRKMNNQKGMQKKLLELYEFAAREVEVHSGVVENEGDYNSFTRFHSGGPRIFTLRLQPNQPSLHSGAGSDLTTYLSDI